MPVSSSDTTGLPQPVAAVDERRRLAMAWHWIEEFLARRHPQLGRDGDVCPFVTRSLSRGLLHVESFDARKGDEAMRDRVRSLRDALLETSASAGDSRVYLSSVIIPYGQTDRVITRQIECVQSMLKPEFVSQGMMIGEFWPGHTMPGLHNQSFRPLAAPVPMLAIRHMVVSDLLFLSGPHIPPVTRVSLLADYERNLGLGLTGRWRVRCHEAMAAAARAAAREAGQAAVPNLAAEAARLRRAADVAPSRALYALCLFRVPDHLRYGPCTVTELARRTGTAAQPLARVLRAAAELDVVAPSGPGRWALRPSGRLLCTDEPGSLRAELADNDLFTAWTRFADSMRTGEPCYPAVFGAPIFDRLTSQEVSRAAFCQHMHTRARTLYAPLLDLGVWPARGMIVDVCGGTGGLLALLLAARPGLAGVLHDRPEVLALSPLPGTPEGARITFAPGDVFDTVPADGDLYVLASVLHDWNDEQAAMILARCRAAMKPGAELFLLERVLPESGSGPAAFADLWMLAMTGGRERTRDHWRSLLTRASLRLSGIHTVNGSEVSLLACRPDADTRASRPPVPATPDMPNPPDPEGPKEDEH